jgi:hypothetical protein
LSGRRSSPAFLALLLALMLRQNDPYAVRMSSISIIVKSSRVATPLKKVV